MGNPRPSGGDRRYLRHYTASATSIGNTFAEQSITVPARGLIRRVRADVTAGTSISQVSVEVREATSGTGNDVVLAYPLQSEPLDDDLSVGPVYYERAPSGENSGGPTTTLFVAVKVDNATADHTVAISLDIEATE